MNQNKNDDSQSSGENEISHSEMQQKLAIVEKGNTVMKLFEDNKCSVAIMKLLMKMFISSFHPVDTHFVVDVLITF